MPEDQDVWIQLLQDTTTYKERMGVMLNMYTRDQVPVKRLDLRYADPTLEYVKPLFPKNGKNCCVIYLHNGWCFKLKAGTYFLMASFRVPDQRKFMVRVIGDGLKLTTLE